MLGTSEMTGSPQDLGSAVSEQLSDDERAFVYRWLAGVFARELSVEALAAYRTEEGVALLQHLEGQPALAGLARQLAMRTAGEGALGPVAGELAGAFARLFLSAGGRRSAPPYESAYTSERGLLFQDATDHMAKRLTELALTLPRDFPEPPDHIAVQLSVMAELASRGAERGADQAQEELIRMQQSFAETRLIPWAPRFRDDCVAYDRSGFYTAAADSLVAFVMHDVACLQTRGN